jgi:putative addiction module killer protein
MTPEFNEWLSKLGDQIAKARIVHRIRSAEQGNFGDCKPVGDGISEMRVHVRAGYRIYYTRRERIVYLVLCGGDKSSQDKDIKHAKKLAKEFEKEDKNG